MEEKENKEVKNLTSEENKSAATFIIVLIIFLWIFISLFNSCSEDEERRNKPVKPLTRKEKIENMFYEYGTHKQLSAMIINNLNDPNSYEHIQTWKTDMDSVIFIKTIYTAKNKFGGRIKKQVEAYSNLDGEIIEIIQ